MDASASAWLIARGNKTYAFVSDYARLQIVYNEGGIYLDVDVEMLRNIEALLHHKMFCGFSCHVPRINTRLGFGAEKENPIIGDMIDIYKYEHYETDWGFNKMLCQHYNTKVLVAHGLVQNGRTQCVDGAFCYSKDYFDPISSYYGIAPNIGNAVLAHKSANSWVENRVLFKNKKIAAREGMMQIQKMIEKDEADK